MPYADTTHVLEAIERRAPLDAALALPVCGLPRLASAAHLPRLRRAFCAAAAALLYLRHALA